MHCDRVGCAVTGRLLNGQFRVRNECGHWLSRGADAKADALCVVACMCDDTVLNVHGYVVAGW